jgi:hypothetical protein
MKKITAIFILACTSVVALPAIAAIESQPQEILKLPDFVVTAQRVSAEEKAIKSNLDELRQVAHRPIQIEIQLPSLGNKVVHQKIESIRPASALVIAKS